MPESAPRLARSAGVIGLATMTSRILGLVREQVLAYYFGAGDAMDAFRVAFRVPNLLRDLFAEGAMSAAFVPTFTSHLTREGRDRAWALGNSVLNGLALVTGVLVVAGLVFAPALVRLFAGDYADVPGKLELTITLARVVLPFLTLVAMAAAFMGMLNALGHFFIPALSPATFNVASVVLVVALVPLAPRIGLNPIMIVAVATVVGGILQVAIQWPPLAREGFRYRAVIDVRDPGLRRVLLLMGPGTVGLAATQINVFVNTVLATGQGTGAVSWLDYAFRLMYLPIGLFGVSVATASTPAISRFVAARELGRVRATVAHAVGLTMLLSVPATLGLIVLAGPIVRVIFEHGSFTAEDTAATAGALRYYAIGLLGYSVVRIVSPTFYALGQSRTPVMISMSSVVVNIVLNLTLVRVMGYRGLALGTSIAALINAAAQLALLRRPLDGVDADVIARTFVRVAAASAVMAGVAWGADRALAMLLPGDGLPLQALRLAGSIGLALVALAGAALALRIPEFHEAMNLVLRRFARRPRG
ncbi:MAG TPA: murein biosynthesis integral membrane protein MurJ [Vicinamibacterales bacterium]|nr:murein biosynthesis integral membrane protein MurJ [Vicinamibacterales bacterium]